MWRRVDLWSSQLKWLRSWERRDWVFTFLLYLKEFRNVNLKVRGDVLIKESLERLSRDVVVDIRGRPIASLGYFPPSNSAPSFADLHVISGDLYKNKSNRSSWSENSIRNLESIISLT